MTTVRRWGPHEAPTVVVMVHGVMDRAASFGRLGRRLTAAPGVAALAYDRRGYESAIGVGPGGLDDHAGDLVQVVDGLQAERVVVFGHSYGGTVAWHAVARGLLPAAVATYESPVPSLPGYRDDLAASTLRVADASGPESAVTHFGSAVLGRPNWNRLRPEFLDLRLAEGPAVVADLRSLADASVPTPPASVDRHVAYGSASVPHEAVVAGELAELLGVTAVAIPDAGHGVHLTHPDACSRWLLGAVAAS